MLERITIRNLALISDAELEFSNQLNILSGETGAGKSIIVDALMLLMGGKYDKTMLSYGTDGGFVEGFFVFDSEDRTAFMSEFGIEPDAEIIVTRKFNADGKNDVRINGKSVTAKMLKSIMSSFVDICGQNEYQVLANKREHGLILDSYAESDLGSLPEKLGEKYGEYTELRKRIASIGDEAERARRIDILSYQIEEIERAKIRQGEEEELIEFRNRAMHGEKIKQSLTTALGSLDGENCGIDKVYEAVKSVGQIASIASEYAELYERLNALSVELDDITGALSDLHKNVDFDESELDSAENRLAVLRSIKKKYGALDSLGEKLEKMKEELDVLSGSDDEYARLCVKREKVLDELYELCVKISEQRRISAKRFEDDVKAELETLGMKNSEFKVSFSELPNREDFEAKVTANGADDVEFLLSPNLGQPLLPLVKIISGGEMSRFMLALKVISSKYGGVDTLIFDEIDTGISGKIGQEVAKKLADISRNAQVLCVTHLPQIASMADRQYFIEKNTDGVTTRTGVRLLDYDGMIKEISRLSGGIDRSNASHQSAVEMKEWSESYKQSL